MTDFVEMHVGRARRLISSSSVSLSRHALPLTPLSVSYAAWRGKGARAERREGRDQALQVTSPAQHAAQVSHRGPAHRPHRRRRGDQDRRRKERRGCTDRVGPEGAAKRRDGALLAISFFPADTADSPALPSQVVSIDEFEELAQSILSEMAMSYYGTGCACRSRRPFLLTLSLTFPR